VGKWLSSCASDWLSREKSESPVGVKPGEGMEDGIVQPAKEMAKTTGSPRSQLGSNVDFSL